MKAFFDSGVLVKLYITESNSADAVRLAALYPAPLTFTELQENEVKNGLRLKCARGETDATELAVSLRRISEDFQSGVLVRPALAWPRVWAMAEMLSARFTLESHARTLDIAHVAAAVILNAGVFVSFDKRQCTVAERAGLRVVLSPTGNVP